MPTGSQLVLEWLQNVVQELAGRETLKLIPSIQLYTTTILHIHLAPHEYKRPYCLQI